MSKQSNMYQLSVAQWNPFVGCKFDCVYCRQSFQRQAKRQKKNCLTCYHFTPHMHSKRLSNKLPKTKYTQFVFTCANSDVSFCPTDYLNKIIERISKEKDKTFLIQSKNPTTFNRVTFPNNVVLGITLETNRDQGYNQISKAPKPSKRYKDFLKVKHSQKMVTIEPVLEFDHDILVKWIRDINPCMIWLGYDSKNSHLPEPDLAQVKELHWELSKGNGTCRLQSTLKVTK